MTEQSGLGEAILLRLVDRLVTLEQHAASNVTALRAVTDNLSELRSSVSALSHEVDAGPQHFDHGAADL